jgi:hypothetical protein
MIVFFKQIQDEGMLGYMLYVVGMFTRFSGL